jgi:CspA family cold shock protein
MPVGMQVGTVRSFDAGKGYGFIECESGTTVFFHHTEILMEGYRTLDAGTPVEFSLVRSGEKGKWKAVQVRAL